MTREEIKNTPEIVDFMLDKSVIVESRMKLHERLEEICELAIKDLNQEPILDKIRAEIDSHCSDNRDRNDGLYIAMKIIDKYKGNKEE